MFKNLTAYEIATLPQTHNLTDGHAFRRFGLKRAGDIYGPDCEYPPRTS
jgi:hypothetical protein